MIRKLGEIHDQMRLVEPNTFEGNIQGFPDKAVHAIAAEHKLRRDVALLVIFIGHRDFNIAFGLRERFGRLPIRDRDAIEALQILARLYTADGRYRDSFYVMRSAMDIRN